MAMGTALLLPCRSNDSNGYGIQEKEIVYKINNQPVVTAVQNIFATSNGHGKGKRAMAFSTGTV